MELSRAVRNGDVVTIRGGKVIRCGGKATLCGVWENGSERRTLTLEGERVLTHIPRGIVVSGPISAYTTPHLGKKEK